MCHTGWYVAETNFAARKQQNVFASGKNIFAEFPDTNFASETYVSQFSVQSLATMKAILTTTMVDGEEPQASHYKREEKEGKNLEERGEKELVIAAQLFSRLKLTPKKTIKQQTLFLSVLILNIYYIR